MMYFEMNIVFHKSLFLSNIYIFNFLLCFHTFHTFRPKNWSPQLWWKHDSCVCVFSMEGGWGSAAELCAPLSSSRQPCQNLLGAIFLGPAARSWHVSERGAAGPKENYQENSFAYITGLSANQSALSKHRNPNRAGSGPLMRNTRCWGPFDPPITRWLPLIGCIKHSSDVLIMLHSVTNGLQLRSADIRTSAALRFGSQQRGGCDVSRTLPVLVSGVLCSMWGPDQVLSSLAGYRWFTGVTWLRSVAGKNFQNRLSAGQREIVLAS